ncbi:hypothetical protein [Flavobacterium sp.]|uniref:hypothetical protein n=1 Tax=Flavobacterium sp. TaxID=239 RepID=UPI0031D7C4E0
MIQNLNYIQYFDDKGNLKTKEVLLSQTTIDAVVYDMYTLSGIETPFFIASLFRDGIKLTGVSFYNRSNVDMLSFINDNSTNDSSFLQENMYFVAYDTVIMYVKNTIPKFTSSYIPLNVNVSLRKYLVFNPELANVDFVNNSTILVFDVLSNLSVAPMFYQHRQYGVVDFTNNVIEPIDFLSYKMPNPSNLALRVYNLGIGTGASTPKFVLRVYFNPFLGEYAVRMSLGDVFDFATSYKYLQIDSTPNNSANQQFKKVGYPDFFITSMS